ncbi:unnamed protein product [Paramecium sonneborni]|uniref:Tetratricopeptide repeat protein n=1 Tax=Paramecium sonneborni TaxID=65129 RepID=A0A8S1QXL9_9CILI|nr:unnamed protein product [Paramecium sonneborni]
MIQTSVRKSAKDYYDQGQTSYDQQNWQQSLIYLEKAISMKPDYLNAQYLKGCCLFYLDRYSDAVKSFEKVLSLNPNHMDSYYCKGYTLNCLKRYQESIKCLNKVLTKDQNNEHVHLQIGFAYENLGFHLNALKCYDKALSINQNYDQAYLNKGITLNQLQKYQDALYFFEKAISIQPDNETAFLNKGMTCYYLGAYHEALECFEIAISIFSNNSQIHLNKALTLNKLNKYQEALESCNQAIKINPKDAQAYYNKGITLTNLKLYNDALLNYNKSLLIDPNYTDAYMNKGKTLKLLFRYKDSLSSFNQVLSINKQYTEAYLEKGDTFYQLKQYQNALKCYNQALLIEPKNKTILQFIQQMLSLILEDGNKCQKKKKQIKTKDKLHNYLDQIKQEKVFLGFTTKLIYQRIDELQQYEIEKYLHFQSVFYRLLQYFSACVQIVSDLEERQVDSIDISQIEQVCKNFKTFFKFSNNISFIPEVFQLIFKLLNQFLIDINIEEEDTVKFQFIVMDQFIQSKFESFEQMELEFQKSIIKFSEELPNELEIITHQEEVFQIAKIESINMTFANSSFWLKGIENTLIILKYLLFNRDGDQKLSFRDVLENAYYSDENQLNAFILKEKNDSSLQI